MSEETSRARPEFSPALEHEAADLARQVMGRLAQGEAQRPRVQGVAIDGVDSTDRDDAIWFRMDEAGHLVVEVTVADVAASLPPASKLDAEARKRASTDYRNSKAVLPMLPRSLSSDTARGADDGAAPNGLLSLTDRADRLGLTTRLVIDVSKADAPVLLSSEIFPSLICAEVRAYESVHEKIEQREEGENKTLKIAVPGDKGAFDRLNDSDQRYALWAYYSRQFTNLRLKGGMGFQPATKKDGEIVKAVTDDDRYIEYPANQLFGRQLVAECALLANRANAMLATHCNLPFPFRIHGVRMAGDPSERVYYRLVDADNAKMSLLAQGYGTQDGNLALKLQHAAYRETARPHIGIGYDAYAHTTSPIRRYPDIVAQRVEHWMVAGNQELATGLAAYAKPPQDVDAMHRRLWALQSQGKEPQSGELRAGELLGLLYRAHCNFPVKLASDARSKLESGLRDALLVLGVPLEERADKASQLAGELMADDRLKAPYTILQMSLAVRRLNETLEAKRDPGPSEAEVRLMTELNLAMTRMNRDVLALLNADDAVGMTQLTPPRFSALLRSAAAMGMMDRVPPQEVKRRFDQGKLQLLPDLMVIFSQLKSFAGSRGVEFELLERSEEHAATLQEWRELKEYLIAQHCSNNPSATKTLLDYTERQMGWRIMTSNTVLIDQSVEGQGPIASVVSLDRHPPPRMVKPNVHRKKDQAAPDYAVPPEMPGEVEVSPIFSVGFWGKSTRHHARVEFLRALALGELQKDEPRLPVGLELLVYNAAHFDRLERPPYKMIRKIAEDCGIHITPETRHRGYRLLVDLDADVPVRAKQPRHFTVMADAGQPVFNRHEAWQALMRHPVMRPVQQALFAREESLEVFPLNAEEAVESICNYLFYEKRSNCYVFHQGLATDSKERTVQNEKILKVELTWEESGRKTQVFEGKSTQAEVAATLAYEQLYAYLVERAEHGPRLLASAVRHYAQTISSKFKAFSSDTEAVGFADKVPFTARVSGAGKAKIIRPAALGEEGWER